MGSCVVGFLVGLALTAISAFCYLKRRQQRIPGSPHYISKQNPYVTVPLKEVSILYYRTRDPRSTISLFLFDRSTPKDSPVFPEARTVTERFAPRTIQT